MPLMPQAYSHPWISDQGDGTFRNPVLHADYSDPDVIRVGDDFWMTASSFNCTPGLPILHSRDLVNWTLVNHAVRQVPHPRYAEVQPGCGIWAPSIRSHAGTFWIFFPMPDEGIFVTTADDPAGAWSEPWLLQAARGWIDPCPFWDDDGRAYLAHAYANSRAGKRDRIDIRPMSPDGRCLLGEGAMVIYAPHHPYLEGPKVHRIGDWYYIFAPGGGVPTGWQVAFRSRDIYGPYEEKIVLERGSTDINGPHQGAMVELRNGDWWFLHFQDTGPFGRIVHLQPAAWKDGWPEIGVDLDGNGVGEPVPSWKKPAVGKTHPLAAPATSDEFDAPALGCQWQWHANHDEAWASLGTRPGWLRLRAQPSANLNLALTPHFLAQKFPARSFAVETLLDPRGLAEGERAGLAVAGGRESAALAVRRVGQRFELCWVDGRGSRVLHTRTTLPLRLKVEVVPDGTCTFGFADMAGESAAGPMTFLASEGGWLGAKVGLFASASPSDSLRGQADFDWFRFTGPA